MILMYSIQKKKRKTTHVHKKHFSQTISVTTLRFLTVIVKVITMITNSNKKNYKIIFEKRVRLYNVKFNKSLYIN